MVENLRVITSRRRGAIMATVETTTTCNVTFPCPRKPSDSWSRRGRPNTFRFKANTFTSDTRFYQHQPQLNDYQNIFFFAQWVGHGLSSLSGVTQKGGFLEGKNLGGDKRPLEFQAMIEELLILNPMTVTLLLLGWKRKCKKDQATIKAPFV